MTTRHPVTTRRAFLQAAAALAAALPFGAYAQSGTKDQIADHRVEQRRKSFLRVHG